ncbi:hypothetical protein [Rhizobium sp. Root483D2]|nr:hypothetical protein [Rhizobium sp. Root483D2]
MALVDGVDAALQPAVEITYVTTRHFLSAFGMETLRRPAGLGGARG